MPKNRRADDIEPFQVVELLTRAKQLEKEGHDVIHMEVGEPDFPTPDGIIEAGISALRDRPLGYTPALGIPELRQAIAEFYWRRHRVQISPQRIVVTAGASGALMLACGCLTQPGSEWLLPDPGYPCNRAFIRAFEGIPVSLSTDAKNGFQPTAHQVAEAWREGATAGIVLASPANPTGTRIGQDSLAQIANLVLSRHGALIVDEIYAELVYDVPATTVLANPSVDPDDVWVVQSFSKYWQMTGWRLGWLVVPTKHLRAVEKLAQNLFIAPSTPAQYAALAAFRPDTLAVAEERRAILKDRRDVLLPLIERLGFSVPATPQGAFYVYADASLLTSNSYQFSRELLEHSHVAITPGIDFGQNRPERFVRFAYTTDSQRLVAATERMRRHCQRKGAP